MLNASQEMIDKINGLSNKQLIEIWEHTEKQIASVENVLIRDAIMQVVENKFPLIFKKWMDNDFSKNPDGENLRYYFKKSA